MYEYEPNIFQALLELLWGRKDLKLCPYIGFDTSCHHRAQHYIR